MRQSTQTIVAVLSVVVLAIAFWLLLLGPKREKADELAEQTSTLSAEVSTQQQRVVEAIAAKRKFPDYYRQLVVIGKAVPAEAGTPSLLVQLNGVGASADTQFQSIRLGGAEGGGEVAAGEAGAMLPIGATIGAAGLPALPYGLHYEGGFFDIADFLEGLDAQVETVNGEVVADGRLVTVDSFNMLPVLGVSGGSDSGRLKVDFQVTTYVAPPGEGLTAGAGPDGPETAGSE